MKKLVFVSLLMFFALTVFAQNIVVRGKISGKSDGLPLSGVNVVVKGTTNGTITSMYGDFEIEVQKNQSLIFSFLGFASQEVLITNQTELNIVLESSSIDVDEVLITALGISRKKKALGYAVTEVMSDDISRNKTVNVVSALQGKVAGLDISSVNGGSGASSRIVLRGISSLMGDNQPLIVVDGIPIDNTNLGSAGTGQFASGLDLGDGISNLNSDDINSISVLKGPSAAALYGSRATNGVLMITTKQGKKSTKIGVEVSSQTIFESLSRNLKDNQMVYGQGRNGTPPGDFSSAKQTAQFAWGGKLDPNLQVIGFDGKMHPYGLANNGNNVSDFFRTGIASQNTVALNGGNKKGTFRLSYGRTDVADIVPKSGLVRDHFNLRGSWQFTDKFEVDTKMSYFLSRVNNRPELADSPSNIGNSLLGLAPNINQSMLANNYQDKVGDYLDWNDSQYRINPYWVINRQKNESQKDKITGLVHLNYKLKDWLNVDYLLGTDYYNFYYYNYSPKTTPRKQEGGFNQKRIINQETNHQLLLNFDKEINANFSISGNIGGNIRIYKNTQEPITASNAITGTIISMNDFKDKIVSVAHPNKQVNSLYGIVKFSYQSWLYLDASLRNDWSSTLPKENRSYMYPSVSGSVILSEILKIPKVNFLKLRTSWAQVGGDTDPYALDKTYSNYDVPVNGQHLMHISSSSVPNKNLKPTSTNAIEFGFNVKALKNRLSFDFSYYNQSTTDQIIDLPLPPSSGYESAIINAGKLLNRGFELGMSGTPIKTRYFSWDLFATWSKNENKIEKLHEDLKTFTLSTARWAGAEIRAIEGQDYGTIVGKKQLRYNGQKVFDEKGMPVFGKEVEAMGNGIYDWMGSLNSTFNYKGISLKLLFDVKWGADLFSMTNQSAYIGGTSIGSLEGREGWYQSEEDRIDAGKSEGDWTATGGYLGDGVVLTYTDENGNEKVASSIEKGVTYTATKNKVYVNPQLYWGKFQTESPEPFIYDASYIKLRELSVSYVIPRRIFNHKLDATISLIARNLWTLYSDIPGGVDPESKYNNGNGQGFEYGSLPYRRSVGFMLSFKL